MNLVILQIKAWFVMNNWDLKEVEVDDFIWKQLSVKTW